METINATSTTEVLNDLIMINNDRITGYERAIKELEGKENDLKMLFLSMIDESRQLIMTLGTEVEVQGGEIEHSTTNSGKIYRAWMDVKAVFTGHSRHAILSNCEFGEDAAQRAYKSASQHEDLPAFIKAIVMTQQQKLKASHNEIKALRDAA
ncbi:MAG TPA: PA2169 family four-helix-bundle protein [Ferruginibacter sp.]|jgi:uncharacterized protein (TIGR02284 family)|nr:PA2169 family four-helix-bundle protein [Ferruginibacter sp.]